MPICCLLLSVTVVSQTPCCDGAINQLEWTSTIQGTDEKHVDIRTLTQAWGRLTTPRHVRGWWSHSFICWLLGSRISICSIHFFVCWVTRHEPRDKEELVPRSILCIFMFFLHNQLQWGKTILVPHRMHPSSRQSQVKVCQHRTYWTG